MRKSVKQKNRSDVTSTRADPKLLTGCIDRLIGHASGSLTTRTYTHKTIEELRQAIEMI